MNLSSERSRPVINRLRRAHGQLAGVSKALDRAGFGLIAESLKEGLASGDSEQLDRGKLERLFLSLA